MKTWDELREEVCHRKRERWGQTLNCEPPRRVPGRRPRDPDQEALLTELDRRRIERSETFATRRREPVAEDPPGESAELGTGGVAPPGAWKPHRRRGASPAPAG